MKNLKWIFAAVLAGFVAVAAAEDTPPARIFLQESNGALLSCARMVRETDLSLRLYGRSAPINTGERVTCVSAAKERMKSAYSAYLESSPTEDAKASAKALYAANLALGEAIVDASSGAQLDDSQEQSDFRKARSSFVIDAGL